MENRIKRKEPLKIGENPDNFSFEVEKYDLDLMNIYNKMKRVLDEPFIILKPEVEKEKILDNLKENIRIYCNELKINFEFYINTNFSLFVPPINNSNYKHWLRYSLMTCDKFIIQSYLRYQQNEFKIQNELPDNKDFVDWIEFFVPDFINRESPIADEEKRLEQIMQWVYEERKKNELIPKKNPKKKSKFMNFNQLFINPINIKIVDNILITNKIVTDNLNWQGYTHFKTEALSFIDVLLEKGYIIKIKQEPLIKLFNEKYNCSISARSATQKPAGYLGYYEDFKRIIPDLLC